MQRTMSNEQRSRALIILMLCFACALGIAMLPHLAWAADDANTNQVGQTPTAGQDAAGQGQNVDPANVVTTPEPSGTTDPSDSAYDPNPVDTPAGADDPEPITQKPVEGDVPQEPSNGFPQGTTTQEDPTAKADPTPAPTAPAATAGTTSTPKATSSTSTTTTSAKTTTTTKTTTTATPKATTTTKAATTAKTTKTTKTTTAAKTAAKGSTLSAQSDPPGKVLANGTYYIESARNLKVVIDMSGASMKSGGDAIVWEASRDTNQRWKLVYDVATDCYTIMNVNSSLFLAVAGSKAKSGTNVVQWAQKTGSKAQLWHIFGNGKAGYTIASHLLTNDSLVLTTAGATAANGNSVCIKTAQNEKNQKWFFLPTNPKVAASDAAAISAIGSGNAYTIALKTSTGQLVDVAGISQTAGANVDVWKSNGGSNQKFALVKDSAGFYSIISVNSGQALDVSGAAPTANANVLQWTLKNAANQRWAIRSLGGNNYKFVSKLSGMALTASKAENGSNVKVYFDRDLDNQIFVLKATPFITNGVYSVDMRKNLNQVLDVSGESVANDVQLGTWTYNTQLNEKFQIVNKGNNVYTLQAVHSGKFLTAKSGKVVQDAGGALDTQKWRAEWNGTGISLVNVSTGKAMEVLGGSTAGGVKIISKNAKSTSAPGQRFVFVSRDLIDNGMYTLRCLAGSKLLDVAGESKANGAKLDLWSENMGNNQKFNITKVGKYYKIVGVGSGKAVTGKGTAVTQQTYAGNATQLWEAKVSPKGGIVFVNKSTGNALNVAGGKSVNGAQINAQAANLKLAAQRWTFSPTTTLKDYQQQALNKVKSRGSSTNWYIVTKLDNHKLMVFHRDTKTSFWYLYDEWTIGSGMNYGEYYTPRIDGKIGTKLEMNGKDWEGWCAWYWTYWGGQWFHSVLCSYGTKNVLSGPQLGVNVSKGCVRNPFEKAKWIYDNIPKGTSVTVWD